MIPAYLDLIATDLLDAALDGLHVSRTGIPAPSRTYVSHSRPAVDLCTGDDATGQLSVYLDPRAPLTLASIPERKPVPRQLLIAPVATFMIEWWRCHPAFTIGGEIPDAADLDASASMLLTDLWCLTQQLLYEWKNDTLVTVTCRSVEIGGANVLGPQGGAGGWSIPVRVGLSDAAS